MKIFRNLKNSFLIEIIDEYCQNITLLQFRKQCNITVYRWGGKFVIFWCQVSSRCCIPTLITRNPAIADKPRDAFVQWNGVADPVKTRSPHMYYYVSSCQIGHALKGCRHKYRRTPKIGERWNSAVLRWEAWLTPRYTDLLHVLPRQFCSSATKGVRINRREPKNWGAHGPALLW